MDEGTATASGSGGDAPAGFHRAAGLGGRFIAHSGPLYGRLDDGHLVLGFRVLPHHLNPLNDCHGGMLATFADILLATGAMYQPAGRGRILPTISLQIDFLSGAPLGAWVEGRHAVLRTTPRLIFSQGLVVADGEAVLRFSGISKLGPVVGDGNGTDPLELLSRDARTGR